MTSPATPSGGREKDVDGRRAHWEREVERFGRQQRQVRPSVVQEMFRDSLAALQIQLEVDDLLVLTDVEIEERIAAVGLAKVATAECLRTLLAAAPAVGDGTLEGIVAGMVEGELEEFVYGSGEAGRWPVGMCLSQHRRAVGHVLERMGEAAWSQEGQREALVIQAGRYADMGTVGLLVDKAPKEAWEAWVEEKAQYCKAALVCAKEGRDVEIFKALLDVCGVDPIEDELDAYLEHGNERVKELVVEKVPVKDWVAKAQDPTSAESLCFDCLRREDVRSLQLISEKLEREADAGVVGELRLAIWLAAGEWPKARDAVLEWLGAESIGEVDGGMLVLESFMGIHNGEGALWLLEAFPDIIHARSKAGVPVALRMVLNHIFDGNVVDAYLAACMQQPKVVLMDMLSRKAGMQCGNVFVPPLAVADLVNIPKLGPLVERVPEAIMIGNHATVLHLLALQSLSPTARQLYRYTPGAKVWAYARIVPRHVLMMRDSRGMLATDIMETEMPEDVRARVESFAEAAE